MASVRELAMELLLKGMGAEEAALTIGTDVEYIMGLVEDPSFSELLARKRAELKGEKYDHDGAIDAAETLALSRLIDNLQFETDTNKLIRATGMLNSMKRRSTGEQLQQNTGSVVNLHLPAFITQYSEGVEHKKDHQGQVVEVEGRVIQTMPTSKVLDRAADQSPLIAKQMAAEQIRQGQSIDDVEDTDL